MKNILCIFVCMLLFVSVVPAIIILNDYQRDETMDLEVSFSNDEMPCEDCEDNGQQREPRVKEYRVPNRRIAETTYTGQSRGTIYVDDDAPPGWYVSISGLIPLFFISLAK